ncbi:hypothetical protein SKAU_G00285050 [Synaphobranchus kaupii]|uniref:LIM zinc-binding domain-containing protein n=1 Tax=Synaphobranchus kaupii TaxID=118154 RepID=A0A9Q1EXU0_SYNKA|nr:hypothetical protein SKAU_G00285050 [Synaphobranchus kaupii]
MSPPPSTPEQTNRLMSPRRLTGHFQWPSEVHKEEKQECGDHLFSSPASPWPAPTPSEPPTSPKRKSEASSPSSDQSAQLWPWSPADKTPGRPLSSLNSEETSSSFPDHRASSMSCGTPTPPRCCTPKRPIIRELYLPPRTNAIQTFTKRSEVYRNNMPRQSNSFRLLQEAMETKEREVAVRFRGRSSLIPPWPRPPPAGSQKFHTCESTLALQLTESRFRHPDCFICADCGLNLRTRSHLWVGEDVFCERHARERRHGRASTPHSPISPQR